ncbi:MAG TPA: GFA family protein [Burkholderiales bacterium]|nr:GFA family protein [Burkholderiales bacterium]
MTPATRTLEGGCQCGHVRYRIAGEPEGLVVCHCTACQRQTGSAFAMSLIVRRDALTLLQGTLKSFTRVADSGNRLEGHFCPACGVRIYHSSSAVPDKIRVRPGTLDERDWLVPGKQIWTRSRQPWLAGELESIPAFAGQA